MPESAAAADVDLSPPRACHAVPRLDAPYPDSPARPRLALTRRALPSVPQHACQAEPNPAMPRLTKPRLPHHAKPRRDKPCQTSP
jgi:hypothetical protein